jgi:peptidyl-prolyl cis-trans isomerase SurA
VSEFAARANLTSDQFVTLLGQNGVERATLEEFVRMGVQWRDYIRARYNRQARISDEEVNRALSRVDPSASGLEILLSEIIIPAPPQRAAAAQATAERISRLTSTAAFSAEARRVSALPSRANGGRLGWLPVANYPPQIQSLLLGMKPGEVTPPIGITNGVALFQMRGVREVPQASPTPTSVVYATFHVPGDQIAAQNVIERLDTCNDLYGEARNLPAEALVMTTAAPADIASDLAIELARLDKNEASANLVDPASGNPLVVMVCDRQFDSAPDVDRDALRRQLRSQRLSGLADALLADLRASATIRP